MIAEELYKGRSCEELGLSDVACSSRKETLARFLLTWDGVDFYSSYQRWIVAEAKGVEAVQHVVPTDPPSGKQEPMPSYGSMFKELSDSIHHIVRSGIAVCSVEKHETRYAICLTCEFLHAGRCSKCGCFMKLKAKFEAMKCPEQKW